MLELKPILLWRVPIALFTLAMFIYGYWDVGINYPIYLTSWGWFLITLYFVSSIFTQKYASSLHQLAFVYANVVTVAFWLITQVFPDAVFFNSVFHIVNLIIMYVDLIIFLPKYKLVNLIIIFAIGVAYALFNMTCVLTSNEPVYPVLTWKDHTTYGLLLGCGLGIFLAFFGGMILSNMLSFVKNQLVYGSQSIQLIT